MRNSFSSHEPILSDEENNKGHKVNYSFDGIFLKRFHRLLQVLFNTNGINKVWSTSKEARKHSLFWLYMTFIALGIGYEFIVYYVGMIPSHFYSILTSKDLAAFSRYILPCLLLVFGTATIKSLLNFMGGLFSLKARKLLTIHLQSRYIKQKSMYTLVMNHEEIDNPDQRITQDIDKFSETLSQIVTKLIIAPVMVIYYTYKCWIVTGFAGPLLIFVYFFLGSFISRKFIQPIVNAVFFKELQEGNFRYLHVRLRQYAESIAFCDGELEENKRASKSLNTLLTYQRNIVNKELPLKLANEGFSYLGSILSYLIIAIPIFAGAFDDKDSSELSAIISANSFVAMYLIYLFTTIIEESSKLSDLAGYTARIGELLEALDEVADEIENVEIDHPDRQVDQSDIIEFENVTLFSPRSKLIVHDFNLKIEQGNHVAFVGPNGSGKTSLLRALACLWPCSEGKVRVPRVQMGKDIIFLPQLPYLIDGSLRDQITYPSASPETKISDGEIVELLEKVRLSHLSSLIESYDTSYSQEWNKLLSPGEQQRLVFARIFYWKPRFAVLDEATSAMDKETEEYLYQSLVDLGTTIISVSHHPNLIEFHDTVVRLDGQGGYTIEQEGTASPSLVANFNNGSKHLPPEVLKQIFILAAKQQSSNETRNLTLVCRAWSRPAQSALYSNVTLKTVSKFQKFHDNIVYNSQLGNFVKCLDIQLAYNETQTTDSLAELLFNYLPNLELLTETEYYTYDHILNALLNSKLSRLRRLQEPRRVTDKEVENYTECAFLMKDRLENIYTSDTQDDITNAYYRRLHNNLHQFDKLEDISIDWMNEDEIQLFEYVTKTCKSLKKISFVFSPSPIEEPFDTHNIESLSHYTPNFGVTSMGGTLLQAYGYHVLRYIMRKFPHLQDISLTWENVDRNLMDEGILTQLCNYMSKIPNFDVNGLNASQNSIDKTIEYLWSTSSTPGSKQARITHSTARRDYQNHVQFSNKGVELVIGVNFRHDEDPKYEWETYTNFMERNGRFLGEIICDTNTTNYRKLPLMYSFIPLTLTNCQNLQNLHLQNYVVGKFSYFSNVDLFQNRSINELFFQDCIVYYGVLEQLSLLVEEIKHLRIEHVQFDELNDEDLLYGVDWTVYAFSEIVMPHTRIDTITLYKKDFYRELLYIKISSMADRECYFYRFDQSISGHVEISSREEYAEHLASSIVICCKTKPEIEILC